MRAETFAFFIGIVYFAAGLLGLVPDALQLAPPEPPPVHVAILNGNLLGVFPVNVLHSAVHLVIGVWGIVAGRSILSARIYARSLCVVYGALALIGPLPALSTLFGLLPLNGEDVWLHAGTAVAAAYFGWNAAPSIERRGAARDRRERSSAVERERRWRDRRLPASEV